MLCCCFCNTSIKDTWFHICVGDEITSMSILFSQSMISRLWYYLGTCVFYSGYKWKVFNRWKVITAETHHGGNNTFHTLILISNFNFNKVLYFNWNKNELHFSKSISRCRVGSVCSVSTSRTVGREFASRPGHTKDHHNNGTNCLPA